jgi:NADP-dependent 3-hydroxy acid dehydrogenase YdfG
VAKVDVTDFKQVEAAVKKAEAIYGPVDLMVNNAGIMPLAKYIDQPLSDKYAMIDTNLKGVINGMDAVLPAMVARKHGTIVNVSSIAGRYAYFDHAVYNATKYGVNGLTEATRKENARSNVRFTLIEPGIVATDLLKTTKDSQMIQDYWKNNEVLDGGIQAESVADVIFYTYQLPQEVSLKEIMITHTKQIS